MLFFEKSQPAPECLGHEKTKVTGNYKCGNVLQRLKNDFKNKCYICEENAPTSINVEHFRPHKGDRTLMFDWNNLFWACAHCNNTKLAAYDDILDCTNPADRVEERLKYSITPLPFERPKIETLDDDPRTESTKALILAVFNGTTVLKDLESANLCAKLIQEMQDFHKQIRRYFHPAVDSDEKASRLRKIKDHLHPTSSFTSFKRWVIRENDRLKQEFGEYI